MLELVFKYDVDEAVLKAIESARLHEWAVVEFKAICRKDDWPVRGTKDELMQCVKVPFQGLYKYGVPAPYIV